MMKLALQNFKSSYKNHLALILSLSFTILIFLNFQYIMYSDAFEVLGQRNKDYVDMIIQIISFVLGCFMFFFIWYATNVFLTKRKKEIGIYVFMGLTNQKIGRLYMLECTMTGVSAMVLGTGAGVVMTQLFQMVLLAISDITVEISFHFVWQPILVTMCVYLAIYLIFALKGYVSIVRSSVLDMVSASRQNEYVRQAGWILIGKTILGVAVLVSGYGLAIQDGGSEVLNNALLAVVLVTAGVYLLFGGLIPFVFQKLAGNKRFLYQKQRALWMNQVIFRMKKNYRTYAMTAVLMLCSVTALATAFAMKNRYGEMVHFRNTYTYQLLSNQPDLGERAEQLIELDNDIVFRTQTPILQLDRSLVNPANSYESYALIPYSELKRLAEDGNLEFELKVPAEDELISLGHMALISLITDRENIRISIDGTEYRQIAESNVPYLGYLQESITYYVVNDRVYEKLLPMGHQLYTYNYRIQDIYNYEASLDELHELTSSTEENYTARIAINPRDTEMEWIKVMYSICIFMFMVFVFASGSILFMKLYNDAFEEKERYGVLKKLGYEKRILEKSIERELLAAYAMPFAVMAVSSYFSVTSLEKMMFTDLLGVNLVSVGVIFVFFTGCYLCSVKVYGKNAGVSGSWAFGKSE